MKPYLLGIDIGTSACKVAVFEKSGNVVAAANGDYPVYYPKEGWAEQNPEEWWSAVCQAVKKVIEKAGIAPEEIAGIGIDGQSWSAIAMDKDGNVLTNTPIWMDTRAQSICDRLNEEIGADQIFEVSGNSLQPSYTTAKILWYKENLPEVYEKIDKILQSNSYIAYMLTGILGLAAVLLTSSGELKALILIAAIFIVSAIGFKLIFAKNDPAEDESAQAQTDAPEEKQEEPHE